MLRKLEDRPTDQDIEDMIKMLDTNNDGEVWRGVARCGAVWRGVARCGVVAREGATLALHVQQSNTH